MKSCRASRSAVFGQFRLAASIASRVLRAGFRFLFALPGSIAKNIREEQYVSAAPKLETLALFVFETQTLFTLNHQSQL